MIRTVRCSSCSTSFPVDPRKVPEEGVDARCSACDAVFFVAADEAVTNSQDEANFADEATSDASLPSDAGSAKSVSAEPAEPAVSEPAGSAEQPDADREPEADGPRGEAVGTKAGRAPTE